MKQTHLPYIEIQNYIIRNCKETTFEEIFFTFNIPYTTHNMLLLMSKLKYCNQIDFKYIQTDEQMMKHIFFKKDLKKIHK